jgi:thioredoxin reductase
MAIDTPAKIAILGAGPIGLEAALYARFLGYDVEIFDRGEVADNIRRWGHVRMFSPFGMNASSLGRAALEAQDDQYLAPANDALLTGAEWRDRYLLPLSQTDLLSDHLRLRSAVVAIARDGYLKSEQIGTEERGESPFRIVVRERDGREWETAAEIVIDATGVFGNANWIGRGGAPAIGERSVRERIDYGIPDVLGTDRPRFADKQVLVIGQGHSAATSVVALQSLAKSAVATRVTWVTRRPLLDGESGPLHRVLDDTLPQRSQLVDAANTAARDSTGIVTHWPGTMVNSLLWDDSRGLFDVEFSGEHAGRSQFDQIIANVGYRPDHRMLEELQVHFCYATAGPMKLAAQRLAAPTTDCLQQVSAGPESLRTPEPNFYILGAKSYGRGSPFLVATGILQIRDLFTIIGDRENLDLYQGAERLSE